MDNKIKVIQPPEPPEPERGKRWALQFRQDGDMDPALFCVDEGTGECITRVFYFTEHGIEMHPGVTDELEAKGYDPWQGGAKAAWSERGRMRLASDSDEAESYFLPHPRQPARKGGGE